MKNIFYLVTLLLICTVTVLTGCVDKPVKDGAYDFVIYESDSDNSLLSDNIIVARYHIEYSDCKTVLDTLILKDGKYYFSEESSDYLVLEDSQFGLTYKLGYFKNYHECSSGSAIDVSWSYTAVNGISAMSGISDTGLEGLTEYGFVINGWK